MKSKCWMIAVALGVLLPMACRAQSAQPAEPQSPTSIQQELDAMKARIAELEAQQKAAAEAAAAKAATATTAVAPVASQSAAAPAPPDISAETTTKSAPFPGDWTWLNSNGRVVDTPMATKYFTPEIRADVNYIFDFNHPKDDTMGGSTESFRSQRKPGFRARCVHSPRPISAAAR